MVSTLNKEDIATVFELFKAQKSALNAPITPTISFGSRNMLSINRTPHASGYMNDVLDGNPTDLQNSARNQDEICAQSNHRADAQGEIS